MGLGRSCRSDCTSFGRSALLPCFLLRSDVNAGSIAADLRLSTANIMSHPTSITINELIDGYLPYAEGYYVKNGEMTDEVDCIKSALRPVRELYGFTAAKDFGPKRLKVVRQMMI